MNLGLVLDLTQALSFLLRYFDLELCQAVRALYRTIQNLFLSIHHIVIIKVDGLGSRLRIDQILLKLTLLQLVLESDGLVLVSGGVRTQNSSPLVILLNGLISEPLVGTNYSFMIFVTA